MLENDYYQQMINTAINHVERAKEGRTLLEKGLPLTLMKTKITGLTSGQTDRRRSEFLNWISQMDTTTLSTVYGNYLFQLLRRYDDPDKGTSELEWQRLAFLEEFKQRGVPVPIVDIEKMARKSRAST